MEYELKEADAEQKLAVEQWIWERAQGSIGDDIWTKEGLCPRCGHKMTKVLKSVRAAGMFPSEFRIPDDFIAESLASASGKTSLTPALPSVVRFYCSCSVEHTVGKHGCGFFVQGISGP